MLTKTAALKYRSTSSESHAHGLSSYPEAWQYILPTYATDKLVSHLKKPTELENTFESRVGNAVYHVEMFT